MNANVSIAKLVNLDAGMDLAKGERRGSVIKKRFYFKTERSSNFFM